MTITPAQIQTNYIEAFQFLEQRKTRQVAQLVLLNNLQKGDQTISSTLLLTLFNRTLSSLYDDKMQVKFLPSQGITQDQINSYNVLAQSDYQEMNKAKLDYDWCWDTLFFGRGYVETFRFDKKRKIMVPHVINPLVMGYDPYFEDPQDWRYYWKWLTKSRWEIERLIKSGKITGITSSTEIASGVDSRLWEYKQKRDQATKAIEPPAEPAMADVFQILEYFGYDENGDKCAYWVDKHFSKVLMKEKLVFDDLEHEDGSVGSKWPIIVKESFRVPHASVPFSVADLLDDKHRAKSVLLNLAFIAAKDTANPLYGYNPDKVKDVAQFFNRQINQHIPMESPEAAWPLQKSPAMTQDLVSFIQMMDAEAEEPVGAGKPMSSPGGATNQTATQAALDQQLNDMAQSLQSKVLQFGENAFWSSWWQRYRKHGPELKSKLANVVGVNGITTTEVAMSDFQTDYPPGVLVYSAKEAEYKNMVKRREMQELYPNLMQSMTPDGFKNFNKHVFWPLMLEDPSLIDVMFPKGIEEMKAEEQNEMLKEDKLPPVLDSDDHTAHLYIHYMLQPKTWAAWVHIKEHQDALAKQQAQQAMVQLEQGSLESPQLGTEKKSPIAAAAPLKTEMQKTGNPINK